MVLFFFVRILVGRVSIQEFMYIRFCLNNIMGCYESQESGSDVLYVFLDQIYLW